MYVLCVLLSQGSFLYEESRVRCSHLCTNILHGKRQRRKKGNSCRDLEVLFWQRAGVEKDLAHFIFIPASFLFQKYTVIHGSRCECILYHVTHTTFMRMNCVRVCVKCVRQLLHTYIFKGSVPLLLVNVYKHNIIFLWKFLCVQVCMRPQEVGRLCIQYFSNVTPKWMWKLK